MKLTRRNAGTAYGARLDGYDFHIAREGKGWRVVIRELTTTVDVEHALGQPVLHVAHEDTLSEIRDILDEWPNVDDYPSMRWSTASSNVISRQIESIRDELKNLGVL